MKRTMGFFMLMVGLALGASPALSQVGPPPGAGQRRGQEPARQQELERRLQARFGENIRSRLGLDAEKLRAIQGVMQAFQAERQTLNRSHASLRYRLRDPGLPDMPDAEARAFLQELVAIQDQELALYRREQEQLLGVLTPAQVVLFYRLREDLGRRIQELRQGGGGLGVGGLGERLPGSPPEGLLPGAGRGGGGRFR